MRIWTALGAWAGLMAVAISLYGLGLALDASKPGSGSGIIPWAIGLAVLATVIFAGDLVLLGRREVLRWLAERQPPVEYGLLDYQPEFAKAISAYTAAQTKITTATEQTTAVYTRKGKLIGEESDAGKRQALAGEIAQASKALNKVLQTNLVIMKAKADTMRRCLTGILNTTPVVTQQDLEALADLRENIRTSRQTTHQLGDSIKFARRGTRQMRRYNFSMALNAATRELDGEYKAYRRTTRRVVRHLRSAEARVAVKYFLAKRKAMP